jgi:hypothetical protein
MSTLGHRLAFGWGFFFAIFCVMVGLIANGYKVVRGVQIIVVIANVALMLAAWFQCASEKRKLEMSGL